MITMGICFETSLIIICLSLFCLCLMVPELTKLKNSKTNPRIVQRKTYKQHNNKYFILLHKHLNVYILTNCLKTSKLSGVDENNSMARPGS